MIQFNLLPDVKLEYIRSRRMQRSVTLIAVVASALSVGLLILLFLVVNGIQKTHLKNLDNNISTLSTELESDEELSKILTIQNQLTQLPGLHEEKPQISRMKNFLLKVRPTDPAEVSYGIVDVNTAENIITITGRADTFKSVNTLVDALKFVKYSVDGEEKEEKPFTKVTIIDFEIVKNLEGSENSEDDGATYTIEMVYDPIIFDNTQNVSLILGKQISTRSLVGRPLFEEIPTVDEQQPLTEDE